MRHPLHPAATASLLCAASFAGFGLSAPALAQQQVPSRVDIAWNRFYDYGEIENQLRALTEAYPDLLTLASIGTSEQGREMWLVTLNVETTGPHHEKPAMWIDGNVHGNEIQAAETVVYSIWYLAKSYGEVDALTELMDRTAFYFLPSVNPDGRQNWFDEAGTASSSRSGRRPTDNDFDGLLDEDGPEDLDGDGHIGRMWRFDENGDYRRNIDDPRIIERVPPGSKGELSRAGSEGIDNDGDGRINEDGPGGYDMNRNWPSGWQPGYIQFGAGEFPFCFPETAAVGRFILDRPNIAAAQSYHNSGGMILRGPGQPYRTDAYSRADLQVYDRLGAAGEEMLPFYRYMILHSDLYPVHGGFVNWVAEGLGVVSFTNELWSGGRITQDGERLDEKGRLRWQDRVLFGQTITEWTEHDHPTHGRVLIGGSTKFSGRTPPPFMLEEECHRNFAFTMFHAAAMPELSFGHVGVERLAGGGPWQVTVEVENERLIPTRMPWAARRKIGTPDRLLLSGDGVKVVASGRLRDRTDRTMDAVEHRPDAIVNNGGVPGEGRSVFRFLVTGRRGAKVTLRYEAEKARNIEQVVELR